MIGFDFASCVKEEQFSFNLFIVLDYLFMLFVFRLIQCLSFLRFMFASINQLGERKMLFFLDEWFIEAPGVRPSVTLLFAFK